MENYRENLAKTMQEYPKEQRRVVLEKHQNTEEYKISKETLLNERTLESERKKVYEKYKDIIPQLKQKATQQIEEYINDTDSEWDRTFVHDLLTIDLLNKELEKGGAEPMFRNFLRAKGDYDHGNTFYNKSGIFSSTKDILLHQEAISEETRNTLSHDLIRSICDENLFVACEQIEVLSYIGIRPELLESIKKEIIRSGDSILLEKLSKEFSFSVDEKDFVILAEQAYQKESAYDLQMVIEKFPHIDKKFIDKKNSLIEEAKEKFLLNKQKIIDGIKNRDFLLHTSKKEHLPTILKHGILSIQEQRRVFGEAKTGVGPDMQGLLGRQDCISVFDIFKGAFNWRDKDAKINKKMVEEILNLKILFQESYPERVFYLGNCHSSEAIHLNVGGSEREELFKKYSKIIKVSGIYYEYVDPKANCKKTSIDQMRVLTENKKTGELQLEYRIGDSEDNLVFPESFFDNMDEKKQTLLDQIKEVMKRAYNEHVPNKNSSEDNEDDVAEYLLKTQLSHLNSNTGILFILDPTLSKTFVMSMYESESFVDEEIIPDKILGITEIDEYSKKNCFNSGKVGYKILFDSTIEKESSIDESNLLFKVKGISIYAESPYEK